MLEAHVYVNTSLGVNPGQLLSLLKPRKVPDGGWFNVTCLLHCVTKAWW